MATKKPAREDVTQETRVPAAKDERKSVEHWGKRPQRPAWQHASAAILHGWAEHAHHEARVMELSLSDYEAALDAVLVPPPYKPHPPALSPHAPAAKRKS